MKNIFFAIVLWLVAFGLGSCHLATPSKTQVYYWKEGDSLQKVAEQFGDSVLKIRQRNHIYETEDLFAGFPLVVESKKKPLTLKKKKPAPANNSAFGFIYPTAGTITSKYGVRNGKFHYGVDFGADKGKRVAATESGVVKRVGNRSGYGNVVEILHNKNVSSLYAHLERALVRTGQRVKKNEPIGVMGNTGRSTGVHLHFEIIINGVYIDPLKVLK